MYILTKENYKDVWQFFLTKDNNIIHVGKGEATNNHRNIYINNSRINVDSILFTDNQVINYNTVKTDKVFDIRKEQIISFNSNYSIETLDDNGFGLLGKVSVDWQIETGYGNIKKENFDFIFLSSYIVLRAITKDSYYLCFNNYNLKKN